MTDPQSPEAYEWPEGEPIWIDPRYYQDWKDRYQKSNRFNEKDSNE